MSFAGCDTCEGYAPFRFHCSSQSCPRYGYHYLCVACLDALHPGQTGVCWLLVCPFMAADDVAKALMGEE